MDVRDAIKNRRSVRRFTEKEIPPDAVDALIEAIRWAPSAGNLQARKFCFVYNREIKEMISVAALGQRFIADAPLVVVACGDHELIRPYGRRGKELYVIQDVAAAIENMMLQACELGLGTVWVGAFDEAQVAQILSLPDFIRPVAIIPVGYPARHPIPPQRFEREEVVRIIK